MKKQTKKPNSFWLKNKHILCTALSIIGLLLGLNCGVVAQNASYNANSVPIGGSYNSAFGFEALKSNMGNYNTANGFQALYSNTTGGYNTANGSFALSSNTTGRSNTANGSFALSSNTTGGSNTANGSYALRSNTTGNDNTANGYAALYSNTTGEANTANGYAALYSNTTGEANTANGSAALFSNTTGGYNTANGYYALRYNTTGGSNTANGTNALYYNTTGGYNTANGTSALFSNTTGGNNTANGFFALRSNTTGDSNTSAGSRSLYSNTTGPSNTANGYKSLYANTTGGYNTASGKSALSSNITGDGNTAIGWQSMDKNKTGSNNTAVGALALSNNIKGGYNTAIGYNANTLASDTLLNATAIGAGALVNASSKIRLGDGAVTEVETQFKYTTVSDGRFKNKISQEDIKGLAFIKKLRPVAYNFDTRKFQEHITQNMPSLLRKQYMNQDFSASTAVRRSGFIAQEVEKAAEEVGYDFDGVSKPQDASGNYSLAYSQFVVPLVKAVQELDKKNEQLQKEKEQQQQINQQLQQQIDELKQLMKGANTLASSKPSSEAVSSQELHLFPNPTTGVFTIMDNHTTNATIEVYDKLGNSVKKEMLANIKSGYQLDLSGYSKGTYWVNIISGNKKYTKQIVVQ